MKLRRRLEEKYLDRMHLILHELNRRPLSRRELQRKFLQKIDSPSAFEGTIMFLVRDSRIQKGLKHRSPYTITQKGQTLLEALK